MLRLSSFEMLLVIAICLLTTISRAGEKPLEEMTVEELRTYQAYFYASGGRDPLLMRLPTDSEKGGGKKEAEKTAPTLAEQESALVGWLKEITAFIKIQDYAGAMKVSAEAINTIDNEWPKMKNEHYGLIRMNEAIRNYGHMAARLKQQQDISKEFNSLRLRVDGVVWSPTDAKVVVNGRTMSAGEVMLKERSRGDLRIEMIEEGGVIFQYRGMRFRLPVELYAPLGTKGSGDGDTRDVVQ